MMPLAKRYKQPAVQYTNLAFAHLLQIFPFLLHLLKNGQCNSIAVDKYRVIHYMCKTAWYRIIFRSISFAIYI